MMPRCRVLGVLLALVFCTWPGALSLGQSSLPLSNEQRQTFDQELQTLQDSLKTLRDRPASDFADVSIFSKGLKWALQYDQEFSPRDIALMKQAIVRGKQRTEALTENKKPWSTRKGKLALGLKQVHRERRVVVDSRAARFHRR